MGRGGAGSGQQQSQAASPLGMELLAVLHGGLHGCASPGWAVGGQTPRRDDLCFSSSLSLVEGVRGCDLVKSVPFVHAPSLWLLRLCKSPT